MPFLVSFGFIFFVLLIVGVIVFAIIWAKHMEKKRTEAMSQASALMNFTFAAVVPAERMGEFNRLGLFNVGHSRNARNYMEGTIGDVPVRLVDYSYTTGGGKHQQSHHQTVVLLPGDGLPEFTLAPENWVHKIGQWLGMQDIDFDEHPGFSKNCLLRGQDVDAIRQTFTLEALDFFAANYRWQVESKPGLLAVWKQWCKPEQCPEYAAEALRIHGLFAKTSPPGD